MWPPVNAQNRTSWPNESVLSRTLGSAKTLAWKVAKSPRLAAFMVGVSEASHSRHSLILSLAARRNETDSISSALTKPCPLEISMFSSGFSSAPQCPASTNAFSRGSFLGCCMIKRRVLTNPAFSQPGCSCKRQRRLRSRRRHSFTESGRGDQMHVCKELSTARARVSCPSPTRPDNEVHSNCASCNLYDEKKFCWLNLPWLCCTVAGSTWIHIVSLHMGRYGTRMQQPIQHHNPKMRCSYLPYWLFLCIYSCNEKNKAKNK